MTVRGARTSSRGGERKLVTLLFADLTGYTALAASLDPEEVYGFIRPTLEQLQGIVEDFGGTVPQTLGDGFMAVFGVPSVHEDDEERAVRAALAIRDHVDQLNARRTRVRFPRVHAGINSGEVMVAPSDEASGFMVVGDTVNTASRLADLASEGTILVDGRTHDRTAHAIRYGPRRTLRAKGKSEPLIAYEAVQTRTRSSTRRGSSTVFVDRRDALERIREEFRGAARASRSRVVVVTGEPGTGKSRLASELRRRRVGRILVGRCPAFGQQLPLQALAEAVGAGLGLSPGASATSVDRAVRRVGRALTAAERSRFGRGLRLLLGAERVPAGQARGSVHDAARAGRIAIEIAARERPVIVVIDDLHWADADLLRFLRDVHRDPLTAPVLFLALSRPWAALRGLASIDLPNLGPDDMRTLARNVLGSGVPEDAVDETLGRAGGNPLFLEETLGMLVDAGALEWRAGVWEVADPAQLHGVPSTIRRLIAARLDALPPIEKATLQDAAVAGEVVWDRLLEHLAGRSIARTIETLERRGLLVRREPSVFRGAIELEVKHVLIREVAYESVPRGERADKHLVIARWLEEEASAMREEPVAWLAYHLERAWQLGYSRTGPGPAAETAILAVDSLRRWADRTFAYQARLAESIYGRAITVARSADGVAIGPVMADLLIGRAESRNEMGRHREALADGTEARRIAERISDPARRARALLCLGRTESDLGRMLKARSLVEDARRLFHVGGDLRGEAWALHRRSETWSESDPARELEDLEESYGLFARSRDRWGRSIAAQDLAYILTPKGGSAFRRWYRTSARLAGDEGDLRSRATLARTAGYEAFYRGEYARAIAEMEQARPLAARSGERYAEGDAIAILALSEIAVGSPERALELGSELQRFARDLDSVRLQSMGLLAEARAAVRLGRPAIATSRMEAARRLIGRRQTATRADLLYAEAGIRMDRGISSGVASIAGRASSLAARYGWALCEPLGPLIRGRSALGAGRSDAGLRDLELARSLARSAGASGTERLARLLADQARILATTGRRVPEAAGPADRRADAEARAIARENDGLLALRAGRPGRAREAFEEAAATWEQMGATVWHARALRFASATARIEGRTGPARTLERRSDRVFSRVRTPGPDRKATERAVDRAADRAAPG